MGRIGLSVARRAKGFSMAVFYHNRNRHEEAEKEVGATYCQLDELLERFVSESSSVQNQHKIYRDKGYDQHRAYRSGRCIRIYTCTEAI